MSRVVANALFFPKLRTDFWATYQTHETQADARLAGVMGGTASTMASEMFGYAQSAPVARYWEEGDAIPTAGMLTNLYPQRSYKFGIGVEISQTAIEDDQSRMIMSRVMESAVSFAMLKERHFYWLLTGGTTIDAIQLQPVLPTAPDGAAWFSATDGGGANRFGIANGNIQPTSGVASAAAILSDLYNGVARIAAFRNTQNQPYWNPGQIGREVTIIFNSANWLVFQQAMGQTFLFQSNGAAAAAPSNVKIDTGMKVIPIANPRITTNNWSIHATDSDVKPCAWMERVAPKEVMAEPGNSDNAREWDCYKLYVRCRGAIIQNLPIASVGVQ